MTDKGIYVLKTSNGITYELPNQKMPYPWDSLDFHVKNLTALVKAEESTIKLRWMDEGEIILSIYGENIDSTPGYWIDQNGKFLKKTEDGFGLDMPTGNVKRVCEENEKMINAMIKKGEEIYQSVYQ